MLGVGFASQASREVFAFFVMDFHHYAPVGESYVGVNRANFSMLVINFIVSYERQLSTHVTKSLQSVLPPISGVTKSRAATLHQWCNNRFSASLSRPETFWGTYQSAHRKMDYATKSAAIPKYITEAMCSN